MADEKKSSGPERPLEVDRILDRLVSGPTEVPAGVTSYVGLLGRSSKEGYWRLYLTLDMSLSVEIQESDIVHSEQLSPDKSPFGSLGGTRVFVKKGAEVTTTRTVSLTHEAGEDEFDLDIRLGSRKTPRILATCATEAGQQTCGATDQTCATCLA